MEGIASKAASLAGHLRLGKLIYLYDDNRISIEGIAAAIRAAQRDPRPSLIMAPTHLAYGSPHKQDSIGAKTSWRLTLRENMV